jgi:type IV fimbrial biogenesis protein FimT
MRQRHCRVSGKKFRYAGFTLVELMAVVGISAILLAIAVPSFRELTEKLRITTSANDFLFAIKLVRSEAIKRGTRVDLVPVQADGDWSKGWTVFVDGNDNQVPDAGEEIIFTHGPAASQLSVQANMTDSSKPYLAYQGAGRTRTNSAVRLVLVHARCTAPQNHYQHAGSCSRLQSGCRQVHVLTCAWR